LIASAWVLFDVPTSLLWTVSPLLWPVSDRATAWTEGLQAAERPAVGGVGEVGRPAPNEAEEGTGPAAIVDLGPVQTQALDQAPSGQAKVHRSQLAKFTLGQCRFGIQYHATVDPAHPDQLLPSEGYLGMPEPSSSNWYHGGFVFVLVNGQDIGRRTPLSSMTVSERTRRAMVDLVWHDPLADVRVRFLGLPGRDHLLCEIALDPKEPIHAVELHLACYPSYFTSWNKRDGARRIRTPSTLVEQGRPVTLPAAKNWWGVYYDEVFDVAKGEGEGPCAMLLLPEEATQIAFNPGSYGVTTRVSYPAQTRRMRLAFWDFHAQANAPSLARLQSGADLVRKELAAVDFTPAAIKNLDVKALRAELQHALQSETIRKALAGKTQEIRAWLDQSAPLLESSGGKPTIRAEELLVQSVEKYERFRWELKLAELLSTL